MKQRIHRLFFRLAALLLGLAVLAVLLHRTGWRELGSVIRAADPLLVAAAFLFFIPQVAVMAWRWQLIGATVRRFSFYDSCRMVLAASALNVILPSKLGDLCKGFMLSGNRGTDCARGLGLAGLDKLLDILGLAAVLMAAGVVAPKPEPWVFAFWMAASGGVVMVLFLLHRARPVDPLPRRRLLAAVAQALNAAIEVRRRRAAWFGALALSLLLWTLHVAQIFVFYRGVGTQAPAMAVWSRVPIGIFVGLLPVTLAGIGTRDGAFFLLMGAWDARPVIAWLGLFCTLRYVVMAFMGVPAIMSLGPALAEPLHVQETTEAIPFGNEH